MKAKRFFSCFLLILVLFSPIEKAYASSDGKISEQVFHSFSAESFVLMDADTGDILTSRNLDQSLPMASTTKIMTCVVALEEGGLNEKVKITPEAVGIEGSSIYLINGEELTLEELLYSLMLESANDAAVAIALHISDSVEDFADLMNKKAAEIGMRNSHFVNPNGLQAEGHYSTARDLSLLMRYAMKNPTFAEITATRTKTVSAPNGKTRYLSNHNKLLRLYSDCIGGKTGFTKTAGRCLVSVAEREGKRLICTTLGAPDDWNDHASLFDYGFSLYENKILAEAGELNVKISVVSGAINEIIATNSERVVISLRFEDRVEMVVETPRFLYAPISEGDAVGQAVFYLNGEEWKRIDLVSQAEAKQAELKLNFWQKLWKEIVSWFN